MPLDPRGHWYDSYRDRRGRPRRRYVASGHAARLWAQWAVLEREKAAEARARRRREDEQALALERPVVQAHQAAALVARAALESAGYHRHQRGAWRKMRAATRGKKAKAETAVALPVPVESPCDVARRALEGDESALPALQALLDDPAGGDEVLLVLNALGDQAEHARAALVHAAAGGNRAVELVIEHKLERMRGELAGPSPSPVERLLVDRVVLTWLALHHADYRSTRTPDDRNDRLHSRAQARYLAALKALAQVRRLALPVLQVNVAGRDMQVNNATPEAE